jgi:hypothetical protein
LLRVIHLFTIRLFASRLFRFVFLLPLIAVAFLAMVGLCIVSVVNEYSREAGFQHRYGNNWKVEYEQTFGPLSTAHMRMAIAAVGVIAMIVAAAWLIKVVLEQTGLKRRSKHRHRWLSQSPIERVTQYKRNALLGLYFGVPGILLSILLTLFHVGIFADHANEMILAIFIFLGSYGAVISGCYWWVKAKAWPDLVVTIAFMPLTLLLVPFVRLIVLENPQLLLAAMLMMSFILIVVVALLPNKSKNGRRRASYEHRRD